VKQLELALRLDSQINLKELPAFELKSTNIIDFYFRIYLFVYQSYIANINSGQIF
jgi:hypothetical protein